MIPPPGNSPAATALIPEATSIARWQESGETPAHPPEIEDRIAIPSTGSRSAETVVSQAASNQPLFACQNQKMGIGCHHLSQRILVLPAGLDTLPHFLHKMLRDVLNMFLATRHEGQGPDGVPRVIGAVAVCLTTAQMLQRQGAGKEVFGELELQNQFELSLANLGCFLTFGANLEFFHLMVILP